MEDLKGVKLTRKQVKELVDHPDNFQNLEASFNQSKQNKIEAKALEGEPKLPGDKEIKSWDTYKDIPLDQGYKEWLGAWQKDYLGTFGRLMTKMFEANKKSPPPLPPK